MNPPAFLGAAATALVGVPVGLLVLLAAGAPALQPQACTGAASQSDAVALDANPSTNTSALCEAGLPSGNARQVVAFAAAQVGKSYVLGADGPNAWDCSSLVQAAYATASIALPRTADEQYDDARAHGQVSAGSPQLSGLQLGDLLFSPGSDPVSATDGQPIGHVAIYAGDGVVVEAKGAAWGVIATTYTTADYAGVTFVGRLDAPASASVASSPTSSPPRSAVALGTARLPEKGAS
jgi:cell wall-associated NlpC family hydrolase